VNSGSNEDAAATIPKPEAPGRMRRAAHAMLGALSGALAGGLGLALMAPASPPIMLAVGGLGALGAVAGYRWGGRVHAAIWESFLNARP
jgi:hypothetical protein